MGPEKPPRRTKPDQEPLTIDLDAKDVTKEPSSPKPDEATENVSPATSAPADETAASMAAADDEPTSERPMTDEATASADPADAKEDARADAAAAAFAEKPSFTDDTTQSTGPAYEPRRRESNSSALAAGIVGGLVTLIGAGVLQYAGVLPPLGPSGGAPAVEQTLIDDVAALKAQAASNGASGLETRIATLEQQAGSGGGDQSALKAEVTNLTSEIASLKSALADAQQSTDTVRSELSTRLDAAEQKIEEPASDVQLARAVAVTALKTSIDRGGPFLAELDALKSISPDDPAIAGLAEDASGGVTPRADLVREFPEVATTMLDAARNRDPNQGVLSRLMDSASSAIRVRPVGSVEGTGPDAVIARIEEKLTNGDLKGASLEWEALPESAKTAGAAFRQKLDQRIRVESLIDAAVSGSMTAKQG